jgi:hypothetical protein
VQTLAAVLRRAGCSVFVEAPTQQAQRRFDLLVLSGQRTVAIDVCIPHPAATSYLPGPFSSLGSVAAAAERRKHTEYDNDARAAGATFVPFVIETFGHFGKEAIEFLNRTPLLQVNSPGFIGLDARALRDLAISASAIAVLRGNAVCLPGFSAHARTAAVRSSCVRWTTAEHAGAHTGTLGPPRQLCPD